MISPQKLKDGCNSKIYNQYIEATLNIICTFSICVIAIIKYQWYLAYYSNNYYECNTNNTIFCSTRRSFI